MTEIKKLKKLKKRIEQVFKCPVCDGRGHVSSDYYHPVDNSNCTCKYTQQVICRSCGGSGVIKI